MNPPDKKQSMARKMSEYFIKKDGTTSKFGTKHPSFDHLTYKPIKGGHRGYIYRIPIVGKKILAKDMAKQ